MTEFDPSALGSPIQGPGKWVRAAVAYRSDRVTECFAQGAPTFERVWPAGYSKPIERCTRCKTLKRFHKGRQ